MKTPTLGKELEAFSDPYPVMEHFNTIQGEGYYSGKAAYFIRLAGCDVGCVWCDVKESWTQGYPQMKSTELAQLCVDAGSEMVVVTGGEPLMHNLDKLTQALKGRGLQTNIETSGAHTMSGEWDWICLSPKKFKAALPEAYAKANELKVIVYNKHDLDWAKTQAEKVNGTCQLLIQPEWSKEKEVLPMMIDFVKTNPKWRISLQTHKYMNIP